jgi:hypothetical protein
LSGIREHVDWGIEAGLSEENRQGILSLLLEETGKIISDDWNPICLTL